MPEIPFISTEGIKNRLTKEFDQLTGNSSNRQSSNSENPKTSSVNNIDQLKSQLTVGMLSPNRFSVDFTAPKHPAMNAFTADDNAMKLINKLCFSTNIPGSNYLSYDVVAKGVPLSIPYQKSFQDLTTSHYIDGQHLTRRFFLAWHELVMDIDTNDFNYYDEYTGTIIIHQYDNSDKEVATWVMDHAIPMFLGAEALSYDTTNTLLPFDVTWKYNIMQQQLR